MILSGCSPSTTESQLRPVPPHSFQSQSESQSLPTTKDNFIVPNPNVVKAQSMLTIKDKPIIEGVSWTTSFISDEVYAVAGVLESPNYKCMTSAKIAVSVDKGVVWQEFSIIFQEPVAKAVLLEFTSQSNGWLAALPVDNNQYIIYKTSDGGKTWQLFSRYDFGYNKMKFTFASSMIGWAVAEDSGEPFPMIWQTSDGGCTWQPADIQMPDGMYAGIDESGGEFQIFKVEWNDGLWNFELKPYRSLGYFSSFYNSYTFSWSNNNQAWVWDSPKWSLPETINQIEFIDYVQAYLFPPINYDSTQGLGDNATIWLFFDTVEYLARTTGQNIVGETVPYEMINKMAEVQYGDRYFDASSMLDWRESYYIESNEDGFIGTGHWPRGEGEPLTEIVDVQMLNDGIIEAILLRTYPIGVEFDEAEYKHQRCLFYPTSLDGITYFTLLESKEI